MKGRGEKGREVENPPQLDLTAFLSHLTNSHTGLYCLAKTWTKVLPFLPFLSLVLGFFFFFSLSRTHARTHKHTDTRSYFFLLFIYFLFSAFGVSTEKYLKNVFRKQLGLVSCTHFCRIISLQQSSRTLVTIPRKIASHCTYIHTSIHQLDSCEFRGQRGLA